MNCGRRLFMISWAACLLFVAAASAARADSDDERSEHPIDRAVAACMERDGGNTAGWLGCEDKARKLWEQEMNRVYRALHAKLTPIERRALEKSQRAWIQFRDSEYALESEYFRHFQGTMWIQLYAGNRTELTRTRALDLESLLERLDGRLPQRD